MSLKSLEIIRDEYSPNYFGISEPDYPIIWWLSKRDLKQLYALIGKELEVGESK